MGCKKTRVRHALIFLIDDIYFFIVISRNSPSTTYIYINGADFSSKRSNRSVVEPACSLIADMHYTWKLLVLNLRKNLNVSYSGKLFSNESDYSELIVQSAHSDMWIVKRKDYDKEQFIVLTDSSLNISQISGKNIVVNER